MLRSRCVKGYRGVSIHRIIMRRPHKSPDRRFRREQFATVVTLISWVFLAGNLTAEPGGVAAIPTSAEAVPDTGLLAPTVDWAKERQFWAFRKPEPQPRPRTKLSNWPRQPLDHFVLNRLETSGKIPAPDASRSVLLRRVTFDLVGLPPTPEDIDAFLNDTSPNAYERTVERLLTSPSFGEHFASLWLPLARFAEDQAHQVGDDTAYFYPNAWRYRDWVIRAFNRDLPYDKFLMFQLAADRMSAADDDDQPALGFLGLGPKYYDRGRLAVLSEEWEDRVDTVCRSMLGLTVACARCHDHKFEPIPTSDYYAMAGIFASTRMVNMTVKGYVEKEGTAGPKMQRDTLHTVSEGTSQDLNVFLRGNVERKGPVAKRRFIQILSDDTSAQFSAGSGRRELALSIANRDNPLTARVMVNRLWGKFFGQPLVSTPSNFGHSGSRPVNQELLDDLAVRFVEQGWSVKKLVGDFVLSSTYRQASHRTVNTPDPSANAESIPVDASAPSPMPRRRLTIEQWRDALLSATDELEAGDGRSADVDSPTNHLRTIYAHVSRFKLNDLLMQFDYPDANVHAEKRSSTTTALQKLFVLNSPFMIRRAKALNNRLIHDAGVDTTRRVARAYQLLYSRKSEPEETALATAFLAKPATGTMTRWEQYSHLLLASNEMFYVD
ncbi:MAG: DUF1549 domain-containing protein [Pedosphaera sp.]|nr:DUF1549 domain-containing protein [Pedosphaera sp.]